MVNSSLPKGISYVETKGLDGETNLKMKVSRPETIKLSESEPDLFKNLTGSTLTYDMPNANLYKFQGKIEVGDEVITLSNDQVLLKGSILRNTEWVYGISIYTGHQTKVMKNSLEARNKKSKVELKTNTYIVLIVSIQLSVCIVSALCNMILSKRDEPYLSYVYYGFDKSSA